MSSARGLLAHAMRVCRTRLENTLHQPCSPIPRQASASAVAKSRPRRTGIPSCGSNHQPPSAFQGQVPRRARGVDVRRLRVVPGPVIGNSLTIAAFTPGIAFTAERSLAELYLLQSPCIEIPEARFASSAGFRVESRVDRAASRCSLSAAPRLSAKPAPGRFETTSKLRTRCRPMPPVDARPFP